MQNSASSDDKIYFLIDQPESAGQTNANALLARDVYRNIANFIDEALGVARQARQSPDPMHHRYHNTVLIDGDRGTGKSTVLVNLACYLKAFNEETLSQVHICAPVDPTLLEDHDDLFLNVILAAVLSDKKVEKAQQQDPQKRQTFAKQLQKLGAALEHMQSQREHSQKGMDKLRAFVGNQQLVQVVHDFFAEVLRLLDKKLLILTIDDVDTGLDRAFENLEVVRRYLTSPYVMPIISGDLSLYHEVIWRNFHGRLLKESKEGAAASVVDAEDLAREYARKVLPVQYRQKMPGIEDYLDSNDFYISGMDAMQRNMLWNLPFHAFDAWLDALFNGTVNGLGAGFLSVPIPTIRAFSQLVWRTRHLIPMLTKGLADLLDENRPRRSSDRYLRDIKSRLFLHNKDFSEEFILQWLTELERHFQHEDNAKQVLLVLEVMKKWQPRSILGVNAPLDFSLFNPMRHVNEHVFQMKHENRWRENLSGRIPDVRLRLLPEKTILPFPHPQIGVPISSRSMKNIYKDDANPLLTKLCCALIFHHDFYTASARAPQRYMGRVFEIVVLSFLRNVYSGDVYRLLKNPPFYSVASYMGLHDYPDGNEEQDSDFSRLFPQLDSAVKELVEQINLWRESWRNTGMILSPWLVFNVTHRCFSIDFCEQMGYRGGNPPSIGYGDAFRSFGFAFFNVWSAFAYMEKSTILPSLEGVVSGAKLQWEPIEKPINYLQSPVYRQNIIGLINVMDKYNLASVTALLASHPLCKLAIESFQVQLIANHENGSDLYESLAKNQSRSSLDSKRRSVPDTGQPRPVLVTPLAESLGLSESSSSGQFSKNISDQTAIVKAAVAAMRAKLDYKYISWLKEKFFLSGRDVSKSISVEDFESELRQSFSGRYEAAKAIYDDFASNFKYAQGALEKFNQAIENVFGSSTGSIDKPAE